jgi:hypothetical protein
MASTKHLEKRYAALILSSMSRTTSSKAARHWTHGSRHCSMTLRGSPFLPTVKERKITTWAPDLAPGPSRGAPVVTGTAIAITGDGAIQAPYTFVEETAG